MISKNYSSNYSNRSIKVLETKKIYIENLKSNKSILINFRIKNEQNMLFKF